jgi:hypothetical protein
VILNDREYYYKILEIGMAKFGVKMNFLCILQVSRFVFVLKMNFYNYFSVFKHLWTGASISGKSRGSRVIIPRLSVQCPLDGGFHLQISQWLFSKMATAKGYLQISAVGSQVYGQD